MKSYVSEDKRYGNAWPTYSTNVVAQLVAQSGSAGSDVRKLNLEPGTFVNALGVTLLIIGHALALVQLA